MSTPNNKRKAVQECNTPEEFWFKEKYASKQKKTASGLFGKYYELATLSNSEKETHFKSILSDYTDKDLTQLESAVIEMKESASNDSLGGLSLIASSKYSTYVAEVNRLSCKLLQVRR